jgi:transposase
MKEPKVTEIKSRRKFDSTFKREAVELWLNSGRSAREIAAELGLRENQLHLWKKAFAAAPPPASEAELRAEVAALRRENVQLRQQRDILKKTLGILSDVPSNVTNGSK